MPIKRYTRGSGYTKQHHIKVTDPTPEEFEDYIVPMLQGNSFDERLDVYEEVSRGVLRESGFTLGVAPAEFSQIRQKIEFQSDEWYALECLDIICFIRAIRARGDKREEPHLLVFVLNLGHQISEWKIKAAMRSTSRRAHPSPEIDGIQAQRRRAFEKAIKHGQGLMRAYRAAAKECGLSVKTIQRAVKEI